MNFLFNFFLIASLTLCTPYDNVHKAVLDFLDTVQHQVLVAGYSISDPEIVEKLVAMHQRGIDVEVITDKTQAAGMYEEESLERLEQFHIPVLRAKSLYNQLMHCKFMTADDTESIDGSYNFTKSANYQDNVLHIDHDPALAIQLHKFWNQIKEDLR